MKTNGPKMTAAILLTMTMILLGGCGVLSYDETIDDDDITLEYLTDEYATQLLNDGAEHLIGSIEISTDTDGSPQIILHSKEVSATADDDGTYKVTSSYAISPLLTVPDQMYASFGPEQTILKPEAFIAAIQKDYEDSGKTFDDYGDYILYDVYALDKQALLVLYNPSYVLPAPESEE